MQPMLAEHDAARAGLLSDGTSIEDVLDVTTREVELRVLSDPDIYQLELQRLFAKAWVAVAHESEVREPGDFVTRYIGDDPVIVTRDRTGELQILLNVCSHRGQQVCWAEMGSSKSFRCPFHGWTYDGSGALFGVPLEKEMYEGGLDKEELALVTARVATCGGWVFGTWDAEAPSLEDYLGDFKWYLDALFSRTDGGLEVVGPPQRQHVLANWKMAAEGLSGDAYHQLTLHKSLAEIGVYGSEADPRAWGMYGVNVSELGHGLRIGRTEELFEEVSGAEADEALTTKLGLTPELLEQVKRNLSPEQLDLLAVTGTSVGNVFPNLAWVSTGFPSGDGGVSPIIMWRLFQPRSAETIDVLTWALVERDAPDDVKELARRLTILVFGGSGLIEQDDAESWEHIQRNTHGVIARERTLKYQALTGEHRAEGWHGGGFVQDGFARDDNQWLFWARWYEFVTGKAW